MHNHLSINTGSVYNGKNFEQDKLYFKNSYIYFEYVTLKGKEIISELLKLLNLKMGGTIVNLHSS